MENGIGRGLMTRTGTSGCFSSSNRPPTNDRVANEVIINRTGQGQMCYQSTVNLAEGPVTVAVRKGLFLRYCAVTLFSRRMVPWLSGLFLSISTISLH